MKLGLVVRALAQSAHALMASKRPNRKLVMGNVRFRICKVSSDAVLKKANWQTQGRKHIHSPFPVLVISQKRSIFWT
jgi:hypothetical protein